MTYRMMLAVLIMVCSAMQACLQSNTNTAQMTQKKGDWFIDEKGDTIRYVNKSAEEWKSLLEGHAYHVLREKGTERAFTGAYNTNKKKGTYYCKGCGLSLFSAETKFDSGTGWPSFYAPLDKTHVEEEIDHAYGMRRVEILCHRCGGHLGHVFDDGPAPTGLRYCMNSVALDFKEE